MSLSRPDGTLHKAVKSKMLEEIEKEAASVKSIPHSQEKIAWVIDGMALIQMVKAGNATTFGELSDILFGIILNTFKKPSVKRVDVAFDRYDIDAIKSLERVKVVTVKHLSKCGFMGGKSSYQTNGRSSSKIRKTKQI